MIINAPFAGGWEKKILCGGWDWAVTTCDDVDELWDDVPDLTRFAQVLGSLTTTVAAAAGRKYDENMFKCYNNLSRSIVLVCPIIPTIV